MNYILFYSKGCTPSTAQFKSLKAAKAFVSKFLDSTRDNTDDNWVDCIIEGTVVQEYEGWNSFNHTGPSKGIEKKK